MRRRLDSILQRDPRLVIAERNAAARAKRAAARSTTTVEQFLPLIADLPLKLIERNRFGGIALLVTVDDNDGGRPGALAELFRCLDTQSRKRGLKARQGAVVWTVNGFAADGAR